MTPKRLEKRDKMDRIIKSLYEIYPKKSLEWLVGILDNSYHIGTSRSSVLRAFVRLKIRRTDIKRKKRPIKAKNQKELSRKMLRDKLLSAEGKFWNKVLCSLWDSSLKL